MPEAPTPVRPWPRGLSVAFLAAYVALDVWLWFAGISALNEGELPAAGKWLTWALVVLLFGGWAWRWFVARGWIGGQPTARFGGE